MEAHAQLSELKKEKKLRVIAMGEPVLLTYLDGEVYAISDRCPHLRASLHKGSFENGMVTCPKHHAIIDVKTGQTVQKAHLGPIKMPTKNAKVYHVEIKDDDIFVTQ